MFNVFLHNYQEDNGASSSGGELRAFFIGMGFLPCLVDKVIEENGTLCGTRILMSCTKCMTRLMNFGDISLCCLKYYCS